MNSATDKAGRPWLKLNDARQGMIVTLDGGFTCRKAGKAMLYSGDNKAIYFLCEDGDHFLTGCAYDGVYCVGVYPADEPATKEQAA